MLGWERGALHQEMRTWGRGGVGWRDRRVIEEGQVMVGDRGIEGRGR